MKLIENWRQGWRLWTVRFAALVAALPELLYRAALAAGDVLPTLSGIVVEHLPPWLRAALAIVGAVTGFLRLWKQDLPTPATDEGHVR